jgi:hypothetical protein
LRLFAANHIASFLLVERLTPGLFVTHDFTAVPLAHVTDPVAEEPVSEYEYLCAGFDEIADSSLHACAPGAGDGEGKRIRRAKDGAQAVANFFDHREKIGIEMADNRLGHCLVNTGLNHSRTGAIEEAFGRVDHRGISIMMRELGGVEARVHDSTLRTPARK